MKPQAIICDLDGTLALRGNRDPYDMARASEDKVNIQVATVVKAMNAMGFDVFFTSGRSEVARDDTHEWLEENVGIAQFELMMRAQGDLRPDSKIKKEMLDIIQLSHDVFLVLDDRDSVVKMWRENRIPTWQVNYGDF